MVFTTFGHGGHLEFQIMTHFSLILYIHHINASYEISLKLAQNFYRQCHLKFFMNGCHGKVAMQFSLKLHICNQNIVFYIPMKNLLSRSKGTCMGNFALFFSIFTPPTQGLFIIRPE